MNVMGQYKEKSLILKPMYVLDGLSNSLVEVLAQKTLK